MKKLHLDSEYRKRWELFYLADGTVKDSRLINWRDVEWEKVVKIEVYILNQVHTVNCNHPNFQFFLNLRHAGLTWVNGKPVKINEWCIGWSDGMIAHLMDIDFYTGNLVKEHTVPLAGLKDHIHPRVFKNEYL